MELRVKEYQLPEKISFNFEELKTELQERVTHYETLVYSDEQIQEAKKDRADLNKLKKALNDERIRREKEYMIPFNDFKAQVNEIISIIDKPIAVIDSQVKSYEEQKKQEKLENIQEYYNSIEEDDLKWLGFPAIYNEKWLNASVSMKSIQEEINARLEQIKNDLATLSNLPEFGFEATEVYKTSLDMNKAISEAQRMSQIQKAKADAEAKKAEYEATQAAKLAEQVAEAEIEKAMNPPEAEIFESEKQWISFAAFLTVEQAKELKQFFDDRQIEFKAV